jgi:hypothetical protein
LWILRELLLHLKKADPEAGFLTEIATGEEELDSKTTRAITLKNKLSDPNAIIESDPNGNRPKHHGIRVHSSINSYERINTTTQGRGRNRERFRQERFPYLSNLLQGIRRQQRRSSVGESTKNLHELKLVQNNQRMLAIILIASKEQWHTHCKRGTDLFKWMNEHSIYLETYTMQKPACSQGYMQCRRVMERSSSSSYTSAQAYGSQKFHL